MWYCPSSDPRFIGSPIRADHTIECIHCPSNKATQVAKKETKKISLQNTHPFLKAFLVNTSPIFPKQGFQRSFQTSNQTYQLNIPTTPLKQQFLQMVLHLSFQQSPPNLSFKPPFQTILQVILPSNPSINPSNLSFQHSPIFLLPIHLLPILRDILPTISFNNVLPTKPNKHPSNHTFKHSFKRIPSTILQPYPFNLPTKPSFEFSNQCIQASSKQPF